MIDCYSCSEAPPPAPTPNPPPGWMDGSELKKTSGGYITIMASFHPNEVCMGTSDQNTCLALSPFTFKGVDDVDVPFEGCVDGARTSAPFLVQDADYIEWCTNLYKYGSCSVDRNVYRDGTREGLYSSITMHCEVRVSTTVAVVLALVSSIIFIVLFVFVYRRWRAANLARQGVPPPDDLPDQNGETNGWQTVDPKTDPETDPETGSEPETEENPNNPVAQVRNMGDAKGTNEVLSVQVESAC